MDTKALEVHKALADNTRFRLYQHLRLSDRPVSVREMSRRLSLHPNTLRPHLRRLEEAGLVAHELRRSDGVGRPQMLYRGLEPEADEGRDYRLLSEMLLGVLRTQRETERAHRAARDWGAYLVSQDGPKPGVRLPERRNLAILQSAMSRAGFEPRFRRQKTAVEITLRSCPFRDLADDHREIVCGLHRGLLEGMLTGLQPAMALRDFTPFAERGVCTVRAVQGRAR